MDRQTNLFGQNLGVTQIVSSESKTGKKRYVFVDDNTQFKDYVPLGGAIKNAFYPGDKVYQGDLCEFNLKKQEITVLRTFKVAKNVTASDTSVLVERNEFLHIPHVGMILMKAPTSLTGTGTAGAVTAVEATTSLTEGDTYTLTITANAMGTLTKGDILVEAVEAGATKKMLVQNPNTFFEKDIVFNYNPNTSSTGVNGAIQVYSPIQHAKCWENRMSPLPACVKAINKSRIDGLFEL